MNFDEDKTTKFVKRDISLTSVSSGVKGSYTITKPIQLQRVYWREAFYKGCSICSRKITDKCPHHPSSSSKTYYRMRVLLKQDGVELWVTAFDETAAVILGTSASKFECLDEAGRMYLADCVLGSQLLVDVVKSVGNGYVNLVLAKIYPVRTNFSEAIIDSTKPT